MRILLTWMGMQDPFSPEERHYKQVVQEIERLIFEGAVDKAQKYCHEVLHSNERPGPILTLLSNEKFDRLHVLYQSTQQTRCDALRAELSKRFPNLKLEFHSIELSDPRSYDELYSQVKTVCFKVRDTYGYENIDYAVHLSPGTSQMHAIWILLTKTGLFPAKTYQTTEIEGKPPAESVDIPFDLDVEILRPALESAQAELRSSNLDKAIAKSSFNTIVFASDAMREVIQKAMQISSHNISVILFGPSGTGKELLAKAIHSHSNRAKQPFVALNCGALPETLIESELFGHERGAFTDAVTPRSGYFEQANSGTLFLDEIGEFPLHLQPKLLRALENNEIRRIGGTKDIPVDVRIIAATNKDLKKMVEEGKFREDLYYRLSQIILEIPPLAKRPEDIEKLAKHYVEVLNLQLSKENKDYKPKKLSSDAMRVLLKQSWSGNVRQLVSVLRSTLITSTELIIYGKDLEQTMTGSTPASEFDKALANLPIPEGEFQINSFLEQIEKQLIQQVCESCKTLKQAAKQLGYSNYQTLTQRMEKYGLNKDKFFAK